MHFLALCDGDDVLAWNLLKRELKHGGGGL
jgi:hypothetical protein